jgi:hypothetical protein
MLFFEPFLKPPGIQQDAIKNPIQCNLPMNVLGHGRRRIYACLVTDRECVACLVLVPAPSLISLEIGQLCCQEVLLINDLSEDVTAVR